MPGQNTTGKRRHRTQSGRHSASWWADQLERWAGSGLTKSAYCAANGLNPASFYQWSSRLRHRKTTSNAPELSVSKQPPRFIRAVPEPEAPSAVASACEISLGDLSVSFLDGLRLDDLPLWVRTLRAASC